MTESRLPLFSAFLLWLPAVADKVTLRNNSSLPVTLNSSGTPANRQVVPCATLTFVHLN